MDQNRPIRRALISVSDKEGIADFAAGLEQRGVEIISTGGTARMLSDQGIKVTEISDYTGFPEMMGGRVKTLHPKIHGGILGRRGTDDAVMAEHGIEPIDLVVVNLYPFAATVAREGCTLDEAIENIDIGGPTMVRAAAKNHRDVAIVVRSSDYARVLAEMDREGGGLTLATRFDLAVAALEHTAAYDSAIANYLGKLAPDYGSSPDPERTFPRTLNLCFVKQQGMRYGENPHQRAAFYREASPMGSSIATASQLQGKELSYNNIADTDAALECLRQFTEAPCCVIVKHANPCGVALGSSLCEAYERAFACDSESAFGGIIALNRPLDAVTAQSIVSHQFCEVIIAPEIEPGAAEAVAQKRNIRLMRCGPLDHPAPRLDFKRVNGGLLVQEADLRDCAKEELEVVTERAPTSDELDELLFAWRVCKFSKSNAIVYTRDRQTLGIGCGQTSRVFSARIAGLRAEDAGTSLKGAALASDAFFPFRDGVDAAAALGIGAIIQPGGSIRDPEVISAANEHGMAMVFTHIRHFRH